MPPITELPPAFFVIAAFVFGLLVGSFLNVVIYRVPRGESIIYPGSHCGACDKPVKPYDNIPLLSYALLGGRCRACKAKISAIYPAVELLTGLLFLAVMLKDGPAWEAIAGMWFVAVIVALIFIDARHKLLPDVITYPAFVIALVPIAELFRLNEPRQFFLYTTIIQPSSLFINPFSLPVSTTQAVWGGVILLAIAAPLCWLIGWMDEILFGKYLQWEEEKQIEATPEELAAERATQRRYNRVIYGTMVVGLLLAAVWAVIGYRSVGSDNFSFQLAYHNLLLASLGALAGGGIIWLLRALYFYTRGMEGMGLGDVKMMAMIGAFLGWQQAMLVLLLGSLLGSTVGLVMARRSKQGLKTALPFGIFLGLAALVSLFGGTPLMQWYVGMMK